MKQVKIFILLLLVAVPTYLQVDDTPKLPIYVGRSYDLLTGNPLSDQVDPGFMHSIFEFTYNNKETT